MKLKEIDDLDDATDVDESSSEDESYDSSDDEDGTFHHEHVPILLTPMNKIYYVVSYEGQCIIKMINPKDDTEHMNVFEIKAKKCIGFN